MNTITNYGMANYQMGFKSRNSKNIEKTLDEIRQMTPAEQKKYVNKLFDMMKDLKCVCPSPNPEDIVSVDEGIINVIL